MLQLQQPRDLLRLPNGEGAIAGGDSYMHKKSLMFLRCGQSELEYRDVFYVGLEVKSSSAVELRLIWGIIPIFMSGNSLDEG